MFPATTSRPEGGLDGTAHFASLIPREATMTRSSSSFLSLLLLALACVAPGRAVAAEGYDSCTGYITSLPAILASEGTWCLKQDLATSISSGYAITINTNNVTIDCNGFKVGGLGAGPNTSAFGIVAGNRFHVTVRNCTVRGFNMGIWLSASTASSAGDHVVEDNRVDGNTHYGINVAGDGSIVRRNLVTNSGASGNCCQVVGIYGAYSVYVLDNTISGVDSAPSYARGIEVGNNSASVDGNRISGVTGATPSGIVSAGSGHLTLRGNHVLGDGAAGSYGIYCSDGSGVVKDNEINGFSTGLSNCTNGGGNDTF
jgi:hypothetical protein